MYVSPCYWASSPLISRGLDNDSQIIEDLQADGNTQNLLTYLKSSDHDICLVSIDFAGLTTRGQDVINLIDANPSSKKLPSKLFHLAMNCIFLMCKTLVIIEVCFKNLKTETSSSKDQNK